MRKINRIKRQIKNPRLCQKRKELIKLCLADGLFAYEAADIFKISEAMVSQILKVDINNNHNKSKNKT